MTIFWSANAVGRSGLTDNDLLVLSEPNSDTEAVVQAWRRNLRPTRTEDDDAEAEIEAIVERHPQLFGFDGA